MTASQQTRRLLRSREERIIGGVAGGLGRYFAIDPVIFRIAAVALLFAGGVGVIAYLLALLVVPADDGSGWPAGRGGVARAVALLLLAGLAFVAAVGSGWITALGHGAVVAAAVTGFGLVLLVTAFSGGAPWLVAPALVLAVPLGIVTALDVEIDGEIGERYWRPTRVAALPPDGYELGVGELTIDLRDLEWRQGTKARVGLRLGIGHALVLVPDRVCVQATTHVGAGAFSLREADVGGLDVDQASGGGPRATDGPVLVLDADVGLGVLEVDDEPGHRFGPRHDDLRPAGDALTADGCEERP